MTLQDIVKGYAPYNTMITFKAGFEAYQCGIYQCPFDPNSVAAQAWDRGLEAAMRASRAELI